VFLCLFWVAAAADQEDQRRRRLGFGVFGFLCVYAVAAADQIRSAAAVSRCGFLAVVVFGGGGGQSR
jgi:hypothetical protein